MHLAPAAVVNARLGPGRQGRAGKPLWRLLAEMSPEELVAAIDFRYITDALTPDEALAMLRGDGADPGRADRASCARGGYPGYTTCAGWLGYADDKLRRLCRRRSTDG